MLFKKINKSKRLLLVITIITSSIITWGFLGVPQVQAVPNQQINYQGKMTDNLGAPLADGDYTFIFSLYTTSTGGSNVWTETRTVTLTNGLFSVMLGAVTPLPSTIFNQSLYLGVKVGADPEMTPRKVLGSVPSAFEAIDALHLNGTASSTAIDNTGYLTVSGTSTLATTSMAYNSWFGSSLGVDSVQLQSYSLPTGILAGVPVNYLKSNSSVVSAAFGSNLLATDQLLVMGDNGAGGPISQPSVLFYDKTTGNIVDLNYLSAGQFTIAGIGFTLPTIALAADRVAIASDANPFLNFEDAGGTKFARIKYTTSTDAMSFLFASGGYSFDNNVTTSGSLIFNNNSGVSQIDFNGGADAMSFTGATGGYNFDNSLIFNNNSGTSQLNYNGTTDILSFANAGGGYNFDGAMKINSTLAVGLSVTASGDQSVAMGLNSTASGNQSVAMGLNSTTSGAQSFVFGNGSQALGNNSFVFGNNNYASSSGDIVFGGNGNVASGGWIFFGYGNYASGGLIFGSNNSTATQGVLLNGNGNVVGATNAAIIAGSSNISSTTNANGGIFVGVENQAIGNSAVVIGGNSSVASGNGSGIFSGHYQTTSGTDSAVLGGIHNVASGNYAVILGGQNSTSSGNSSAVMGGSFNEVSGNHSLSLDGRNNTVTGDYSYSLGGIGNTVSGNGSYSFGDGLTVSGSYSAGFRLDPAAAENTISADHVFSILGANVGIGTTSPWADFSIAGLAGSSDPLLVISTSTASGATSTAFIIDSNGKVGLGGLETPAHLLSLIGGAYSDGTTWENGSDRNAKENFTTLDVQEILNKINRLPITQWNFKSEAGISHIGPVAQDFREIFGLGSSDRSISTVDPAGLALVGIQALSQRIDQLANSSVVGMASNWSIGADGLLKVKKIQTDDLMVESGVTIKDRTTGVYNCIYVENGTVKTNVGECSGSSNSSPPIVVDGITGGGEATTTTLPAGEVAGTSTPNTSIVSPPDPPLDPILPPPTATVEEPPASPLPPPNPPSPDSV